MVPGTWDGLEEGGDDSPFGRKPDAGRVQGKFLGHRSEVGEAGVGGHGVVRDHLQGRVDRAGLQRLPPLDVRARKREVVVGGIAEPVRGEHPLRDVPGALGQRGGPDPAAAQVIEGLVAGERDHRQRRRVDQARDHAERPAGHGVGDAAFGGGQRDVHGAVAERLGGAMGGTEDPFGRCEAAGFEEAALLRHPQRDVDVSRGDDPDR